MPYWEFLHDIDRVVVRRGHSYDFSPSPSFGGRRICKVSDLEVNVEFERYPDTFRKVEEGVALLDDEEFVRLVVENPNIVQQILAAKSKTEEKEIEIPVEQSEGNEQSESMRVKPFEEMTFNELRIAVKKLGTVEKVYTLKKPALIDILNKASMECEPD